MIQTLRKIVEKSGFFLFGNVFLYYKKELFWIENEAE